MLGGAVLVSVDGASAQNPAANPRSRREADASTELLPLSEVIAKLKSTNPDEVHEAIDMLSVINTAQVVPPLAELLHQGPTDAIAERAVDALAGLAMAPCVDVLVEMTHHRRAVIRKKAYQGLIGINDRRIPRIIEQGLRDSDRGVRGTCAVGLGKLGSRGSVDLLFRALDRGVIEAATSIGQLGSVTDLNRFHGYLGKEAISIMISGYEGFLKRRDIREPQKIEIITKLVNVAGPVVRGFLSQYKQTFASNDRSKLAQAVNTWLLRIPYVQQQSVPQQSTQPASGAAQ